MSGNDQVSNCCVVDCLTESNDTMVEYAIGGLCNLTLGKTI